MNSFIRISVGILEWLFLLGAAGSLIVVLISGVEDLKTVFSKDEKFERHEPIAN